MAPLAAAVCERVDSCCRSAVYDHGFSLWISIYFLSYYFLAVMVMRSLLTALIVVRDRDGDVDDIASSSHHRSRVSLVTIVFRSATMRA